MDIQPNICSNIGSSRTQMINDKWLCPVYHLCQLLGHYLQSFLQTIFYLWCFLLNRVVTVWQFKVNEVKVRHIMQEKKLILYGLYRMDIYDTM